MRSLLIVLLVSFLFACSSDTKQDSLDLSANPFAGRIVEVKTLESEKLGWGYVIYIDGKQTIHQKHIPGVSGNHGFITEEQAKRTADLVIDKIKDGIFPPSITIQELDSLGIIYK
jgi:hypothetical protein